MKSIANTIALTALTVASTALTLSVAPIAQAQVSADEGFLPYLYDFLAEEDQIAYIIASEYMGNEGNVGIAQTLCERYSEGVSPFDVYDVLYDSVQENTPSFVTNSPSSMSLYVGTLMFFGSAYYCPQYQSNVEQLINSL
jgi:hypothetical protein